MLCENKVKQICMVSQLNIWDHGYSDVKATRICFCRVWILIGIRFKFYFVQDCCMNSSTLTCHTLFPMSIIL